MHLEQKYQKGRAMAVLGGCREFRIHGAANRLTACSMFYVVCGDVF